MNNKLQARYGKCEQCDKNGEIKKDIYKNMLCQDCIDSNINEGKYIKMD